MAVTIRPVEARDVTAAVELVRATLAEFGMVFGVGSETDEQVRGLPASYTAPGGGFWVAVDEAGALIGTAGVFPLEPGVFELRKMYLHRAARGRGVGAQLFSACLAFCRERGARALVLDTVNDMTSAIAFYERRGFVRDDAQIRGARCTRGYRLDLRPDRA
jgi:GNAT superfamily N-acetyltransferase